MAPLIDYESELAAEGMTMVDEQRLVFEEQFAIAVDVAAKRALVEETFLPTSTGFLYYDALCTLLEVQVLLDGVGDAQRYDYAWQLLARSKERLVAAENALSSSGCWRKVMRLQRRRLILELELQHQLKKPKEDIAASNRDIGLHMDVSFADPTPTNATVAMKEDAWSTTLDEQAHEMDKILQHDFNMLRYQPIENGMFSKTAEASLRNMHVFARERFFQKLIQSGYSQKWKFSDEQYKALTLLFVDEFAFEYTDVPGYLDLVIDDIRTIGFGNRNVHKRLSFTQLQSCLRKEPSLFQGNMEFAIQGIQLLKATASVERTKHLDLRDAFQNEQELQYLTKYLGFLDSFTPNVNKLRLIILHQKLKKLRLRHLEQSNENELLNTLVQYVALPRLNAPFIKPDYASTFFQTDVVLAYMSDSSAYTTLSFIRECANEVTRIASNSGYPDVSIKDDEELVRKVLRTLWSSPLESATIEKALNVYLTKDTLEVEQARSEINQSKDLTPWISKLPKNGEELTVLTSSSTLSFCESNPTYFAPEDDLRIHVRVQNVKSLTVHLYEIKTIEYYSRTRREIRGDICLDGLLPNEEQHIDLSHLRPWQEARISVELLAGQKKRRGVFIVEVLDKGRTCRAILRKGFLRHVERITSRGHEFLMLDERGEVVQNGRALVLNVKSGNSRAQPGRHYEADANGSITVPFRQANDTSDQDKFAITFCHDAFGFFHSSFEYLVQKFELHAQMHIDNEQLLPGSKAHLVTRPSLIVAGNGTEVSLDLLVQVSLSIKFTLSSNDNLSTSTHKEVQTFATMKEYLTRYPCFEIPMDAEAFTVTLSGRVALNGGEEMQKCDVNDLPVVNDEKTYRVQRVTDYSITFTPHFVRQARSRELSHGPNEFSILVLGHNGEPIPNMKVQLSMQHLHFFKAISAELQTNTKGEIKLGRLQNIQEISMSFTDTSILSRWTWEVPNLRSYRPQIVNCYVNETIETPIPYAYSDQIVGWINDDYVSVCEVIETTQERHMSPILENAATNTSIQVITNKMNEPIMLNVNVRQVGKYVLYVRPLDLKYPITVCENRTMTAAMPLGVLVQPKRLLLATPTQPLTILSIDLKIDRNSVKRFLEIQLKNATAKSTNVAVYFKRFLDVKDTKMSETIIANGSEKLSKSGVRLPDLAFELSPFQNEYLKERKISDEYTYILQRRLFESTHSLIRLGSTSFPKPSLLQNPHIVNETDMEVVIMGAGEKVVGFKTNSREMAKRSSTTIRAMVEPYYCSYPETLESDYNPSISFLRSTSQLVDCSVNTEGIVCIDLNNISVAVNDDTWIETGSFEVFVLAYDYENGQVCSQEKLLSLGENMQELPLHDIRLSYDEMLSPLGHFCQEDKHDCISAGNTRNLVRTFSSKYALYEGLKDVMKLWPTLASGKEVLELSQHLQEWFDFDLTSKLRFYFLNSSDDFNFFLYRKDPKFFEKYVRPVITAKISKSLIDHYLLKDEETIRKSYLSPGVFQKLSVIEKLLVADSLTAFDDAARICECVIREIDCSYPQTCASSALTNIFNSVLSQGSVKPSPPAIDGFYCDMNASIPLAAPVQCAPRGGGFGSTAMAYRRRSTRDCDMVICETVESQLAAYPTASPAYSPTSPAYSRASSRSAPGASASLEEDDEDYDSDFGIRSLSSDNDDEDDDNDVESEFEDEEESEKKKKKTKKELPYIPPGKVRMIQEKRYFTSQQPYLDGRNMFWKEYAQYLIKTKDESANAQSRTHVCFVSSYFPEALSSLTEGIFALSVLDLELNPPQTEIRMLPDSPNQVKLQASSNVILYHRSIGSATLSSSPNSVLIIKQRIRNYDRSGSFSAERGNAIEFIVNKVYSGVVTLSNIGSSKLSNVDVLMQIPQGAIPVGSSGFYTKSCSAEIQPNQSCEFTFEFYFPSVGKFEQYPAHASINGEVVGWATDLQESDPITVVNEATCVDLTSWTDVCARGSLEDIMQYMESQKFVVDFDKLCWRCREEAFYRKLITFFRQKMIFVKNIWKYALFHSDIEAIKEFFAGSEDLNRSIGEGYETSLFSAQRLYQNERFSEGFCHTEFGPFLSRRVHRVTGKVGNGGLLQTKSIDAGGDRILNANARAYYQGLCQRLGMFVKLDAEHLLVLTYYMILFDRISDALQMFQRLEQLEPLLKRRVTGTMTFDYVDSYLDFFRNLDSIQDEMFPIARRNVSKYAKYSMPRWSERFQQIADILDEYDKYEAQRLTKRARQEEHSEHELEYSTEAAVVPSVRSKYNNRVQLEAVVHENKITLTSQNLGTCEVSFYPIDVELMFSTEPFDTFSDSAASASSLLMIQPREQIMIPLREVSMVDKEVSATQVDVPIPEPLTSLPMMVRVREIVASRTVLTVAPPIDLIRPYFNASLHIQVMRQFGLLQVYYNDLPVKSCYVKVYAKVFSSSGSKQQKVEFYKDGYTDFLGKFDYVGINGDLITRVEKFSILISHAEYGATVEQVDPPILATTVGDFQHKKERELLLF